jgi:hypothetical protein
MLNTAGLIQEDGYDDDTAECMQTIKIFYNFIIPPKWFELPSRRLGTTPSRCDIILKLLTMSTLQAAKKLRGL